jgi:hypothetical protein
MKNNSGRPRKVRRVGPGAKTPRCSICTWNKKDQRQRRPRQAVRRAIEGALRDA